MLLSTMLAFFLIVFIVPLLLAVGLFLLTEGITAKELSAVAGVALVIVATSAGIVSCANTHDVEVWNGTVTGKERVTVSCSHSYSCNCRETCSGSGRNRSCSTTCDTCYEHMWDYDWDVYTSNSETVTIGRIDRQGVSEPPRWTAVRVGEPTSLKHSYTNYVKASPDSLFRHQGLKEKYRGTLPDYPQRVYDYYRLDRFVALGSTNVGEPVAWNSDLSRLNAELGREKQVNIIVVTVVDKPHEWYYALEEDWVGGKKNDVVLVASLDSDGKPQWVEVMAWTTNEMFRIALRDRVLDMPKLDRTQTIAALQSTVGELYRRKPMKDFEYLNSQIVPTPTEWTVTLIIALVVCGGLAVYCQQNDVFGDERYGLGRGDGRFRWSRGNVWD